MIERMFLDLRGGVWWSFVIKHPAGSAPRLIIQPLEGNQSKHAPEFDASAVREFLEGAL